MFPYKMEDSNLKMGGYYDGALFGEWLSVGCIFFVGRDTSRKYL